MSSPTKETLFGIRGQYQRVYTLDSGLAVARAQLPVTYTLDKFGRATGSTGGEVWDGGGTYGGFIAAAETMSIASTDAGDALAGAGAKTVTVYGLDSNFDEISETVNMDGDTSAALTNEYIRINRMLVATAGASGPNIGDITVTSDTGGVAMATIKAGMGQTLMAVWTVPRNHKFYMMHGEVSMVNTSLSATVRLYARPSGGAWNVKRTAELKGGVYHAELEHAPLVFDEKTDIRWYFEVSAANEISATFSGIYEKIGD